MTVRHSLQRRIVIVGTSIILAGLFTVADTLHDRTAEIVVWTEGAISQAPLLGMVVFVGPAMLSAMVAFFSSAVFAPVAVHAWGKVACLALLWLGWLLGGILLFCIGRFFGRTAVGMLIGEEKLASWERELSERSRFIHILLFQAAVPSEISGYVPGIRRYRFVLYLTVLAITELPYAIAVVYLGESLLKGESTRFILLGIAVILSGVFLFYFFRKRIK